MKSKLNVRQTRFCEFVAAGESQTEAYLKAGFRCAREHARKHAARLMTNDDIQKKISGLQKTLSKALLRKKEDNLQFLSDIISTPISEIGPDSPVCAHYSETIVGKTTDGQPIIRRHVKRMDALRAIELYSKLMGHFDPDRTEIDVRPSPLIDIKKRAEEVASALFWSYNRESSRPDLSKYDPAVKRSDPQPQSENTNSNTKPAPSAW